MTAKTRAFPFEVVKDAYFQEGNEQLEQIYEGPWEQDGKYQYQEVIFKATDDGKYYAFYATRSGSPFTDWYYDQFEYRRAEDATEELTEVERKEKVIITWKAVQDV